MIPFGNAFGSGWIVPWASRLTCQQSSRLTIYKIEREMFDVEKKATRNRPYWYPALARPVATIASVVCWISFSLILHAKWF